MSRSESFLSSLPAWSLGFEVRSARVLRCTCTRHRWMRAPGQTSVQALSAPRNPSVTSTSGAGIRENNAAYASFDSCEHHWKPSASPVSPSTATIRHQSWLMYVPSAITVWCLTAGVGISGRMFQHHDVRLRVFVQ